MTLSEKQRFFSKLLGQFLVWIYANGYEVVGGEWKRSEAQAQANAASGAGISKSLHIKCLAVDLSLFINGEYQRESEPYRPLGDYWKTLDPLCRWGGDFVTRPDGNHFSIEHEGVR